MENMLKKMMTGGPWRIGNFHISTVVSTKPWPWLHPESHDDVKSLEPTLAFLFFSPFQSFQTPFCSQFSPHSRRSIFFPRGRSHRLYPGGLQGDSLAVDSNCTLVDVPTTQGSGRSFKNRTPIEENLVGVTHWWQSKPAAGSRGGWGSYFFSLHFTLSV